VYAQEGFDLFRAPAYYWLFIEVFVRESTPMARRRREVAAGLASALVLSVGLFAQTDKKTEDALKKDVQALSKLADAALAAQGSSNDFNVTWVKEDFLKGPKDKEFVPFTITLDPTKIGTENLTLYWRVVPTPAAAPAPAADASRKNDKQQPAKPIWEGVTLVPMAGAQNPLRLSRSFVAAAGSYDVYVVTKELAGEKAPKNFAPKTVVLKQTVVVPEFWSNDLTTSSVIIADRIDPLAAPLSQQQLIERPYAALGVMEIFPTASTKLTKKSELSVFFLIYNPKADSAQKPDINIEYNFCQAAPGNQPKADEPCKAGEKFYNKTDPQPMNAQTLPPAFDLSMGHQLQTGQAVPLASFPEGDYRLEIKVTDKLANKSVTRDVNFSVSAS
jgi:hypothetical protein